MGGISMSGYILSSLLLLSVWVDPSAEHTSYILRSVLSASAGRGVLRVVVCGVALLSFRVLYSV